jgi:hypothetical protein
VPAWHPEVAFDIPQSCTEVHGEVKAYLVSARRMEALQARVEGPAYRGRPPRLRGTLTIVGDLAEARGGPSGSLEQMALQEWDEGQAAPSRRSRRR